MNIDAIRRELAELEGLGVLRSWQISSPDGRRRFSILAVGFRGERVYSRSEIEAFLHGVDAGRTAVEAATNRVLLGGAS